jgi:glycosyltransferase involved in cell wall biosynthesis
VRLPVKCWRAQPRGLVHVVDHGYGDLLRYLPAERAVVTCHDLALLRAPELGVDLGASIWTMRRFAWSVRHLRRAARVICVSEATREDLIRLAGVDAARTRVIPNGIDAVFRPRPPSDRGAILRQLGVEQLICAVTSGAQYKDVPTILRVTAALRGRGVSIGLVRIGADLTTDEVALAESLGIRQVVLDVGRVDDERLVSLLCDCDALLFPSRFEGFGWPPLEAMACGLPVVCSDIPALVEGVGDAALVAPPGDVDAFVRHLETVLGDDERRASLIAAGRARAAEFTWTSSIRSVVEVYQEIWS